MYLNFCSDVPNIQCKYECNLEKDRFSVKVFTETNMALQSNSFSKLHSISHSNICLSSKSSNSSHKTIYFYQISIRNFAKRGIPRGRKRKLRWSKPGLPRGDKPKIDTSPTRTLTAQPWGPPRYPIPRVETTSVEFAQNLNSLCSIVQSRIQCLGLVVSSYNHSSKVLFCIYSLNGKHSEISVIFPMCINLLGSNRENG